MAGVYYKIENLVNLALKFCHRIRMLAWKMIDFIFDFGLEYALFFSMPVFGDILLVGCGWLGLWLANYICRLVVT